MHELAVFSYLMPLAIQAGLFNLVSTRHDYLEKPLIRWTRLGLLPITLSTILSNLISVKDRTHIAPFTKLCIGSMFASQALKSMLSVDNEALIDQLSLGPLVEKYKFEITVFCCGNFIWTNLDLSGCLLRIFLFAIKMVNRSLSSLLPSISKDQPLLEKINQIDLDQTCPILFQKTPLQAKSMTEFWGRHWHHLIKNLILEAGVCLENTFKTFSGRKVNGILGRIWTFSWLIYFATPMVAIWFVSLAASSQYLKPKITEKSITIGLLVVECGLGLKPHHSTKMGYSEE
ncbi:hypothetical protein KEM48_010351 [Puccinia striiformis f. sp. tritici PST-130]|nr:hypothetical protein KEM48_010351 [Puccinia striiformis f. sp. tritici PST-130]